MAQRSPTLWKALGFLLVIPGLLFLAGCPSPSHGSYPVTITWQTIDPATNQAFVDRDIAGIEISLHSTMGGNTTPSQATCSQTGSSWTGTVTVYETGTWNGTLSALDASGQILYTAQGTISVSESGGSGAFETKARTITWTEKSIPGCESSGASWETFAVSADGKKLAAAAYYMCYLSTDSGQTWSTHNELGFYNIAISSDGTKLAGTSGQDVYTSTDGGTNWIKRLSAPVWLTGIACSSDGSTIAVATDDWYLYLSTNGGVSWTQLVNADARNWYDIAVSSGGNVIAAADFDGYLVTSRDGGTTWDEWYDDSADWVGVTVSSDGTMIAAVPLNGYIHTMDPEAGWTERTESGHEGWSAICSSADGETLFASQRDSRISRSTDGGLTWTLLSAVGSEHELRDIACSADGRVVITGESSGLIYTSDDGGETWTEHNDTGRIIWNGLTTSSDGGLIFAAASSNYLYWSADRGMTWSKQDTLGRKGWNSIVCSEDGSSVAGIEGYGSLFVSHTGGILWDTVIEDTHWEFLSYAGDNTIHALGSRDILHTSTDGGNSWQERKVPGVTIPQSFASQGTTIAICDVDGTVIVSLDSGGTWRAVQPDDAQTVLNDIFISPDGRQISVYNYNGRCFYTSNDGGTTWEKHLFPFDRPDVLGLPLVRSETLFAIKTSETGIVYFSLDGGESWWAQRGLKDLDVSKIVCTDDDRTFYALAMNHTGIFIGK